VTESHSIAGSRFEDPLTLLLRRKRKLYTVWIRNTYPFASVGSNLSIECPCQLNRASACRIRLGNSVSIRKDTSLYIVPDDAEGAKLIINDNCVIGPRSTLSVKNSVHLGPNVITGSSVLIQDHGQAYGDTHLPIRDQGVTRGGRIRIEEGCWIGKGAAIVCDEGELIIGRNSVIGANSVVTKSFPAYSVIIGNPGRLARHVDQANAAGIGGEDGHRVIAQTTR
jgi:acetyltransferase-like isoleucine patch superfamily enzyme